MISAAVRFSTMDDRQFERFMMGLFAIAAAALFAIVQITGIHSSVVEGYFAYADAMMHGVFPYTDEVYVYGYWNVWEYPPLAYVFMFIPRIFSSSTVVYQAAYLVMVLLFVWIGMRSVSVIADERGYSRRHAVLMYTVMMLLMAEFVLDRYDVFPVVFTILAVQLFLQRRYPLAAAMIGLGTLLKVYPALLAPIFLIWLLKGRDLRGVIGAAVGFLAVMCIAIPFVLLGDISQMFYYHSDRPLEIECFAASLLEVVRLIVPSCGMEVVYSYGSDNLVGGVADSIAPYMTYFMAGCIVVIWLAYLYSIGRTGAGVDRRSFYAMFLTVCAFIMCGSVFSGQYIIWLIPFVLLYIMCVSDFEERKSLFALFVVVEVFTQLNFLFNFGMRPDVFLSPWGVGVLVVRNLAILYMMVLGIRDLFRKDA